MKRGHRIALVIVAAYWCVVAVAYSGLFFWGCLGSIRPSDVVDGKISVEHAQASLEAVCTPAVELAGLTCLGALFTLIVVVIIILHRKPADSK